MMLGSVPIYDLLLALVPVLLVIAVIRGLRTRRRRSWPGPGAMGAVYDMLNEDKRHAIELIVEQRAEERDPEDKDGNLPDLENPK
jgi:hypothetical protein